MTRQLHRPTPEQIDAADPGASPWVGANAGSGKTRVLTQRVARLLLAGTQPQKILCLTYTKAAAAEMQNRLFAMLGEWAMADDDWLARQIALLEGREDGTAEPDALAAARRLFARALETPGGLKIQTIHSFCTTLLRHFPLEAGLSPRFEVIDDRQAALIRADILAAMALDAESAIDPALDVIAARLNEEAIDALIGSAAARRDGFAPSLDAQLAAHFGPNANRSKSEIAADAVATLDWSRMATLADTMAGAGVSDQRHATQLGSAAALRETDPVTAAEHLIAVFLKKDGDRRKNFPTKAVSKDWSGADRFCEGMVVWAEAMLEAFREAAAAARARDLDNFARAFLMRYDATKTVRGLLDFDDLIEAAHRLVSSTEAADWTLYKLDQGIDHVLVDEAQDTSPRQWALIEAITAEFHAGHGARDVARTLFVVGDEKQSIYSFQGAEPQAFGDMRSRIGRRLEGVGQALARPDLRTSFRSAPAILSFVDRAFAGEERSGLTVDAEDVVHVAHRERDAGRIDLWPLVEPLPAEKDPDWWEPVDAPSPEAPAERLAAALSQQIAGMIGRERLPDRDGKPGRIVRAGDILVLVTRRAGLARGLIRRLKSAGVPVAGADRLMLAEELAVKDLLALAKVSVTPADDLSLAAVLRSPLCDIDEDALFHLAHGRESTLRRALMASGHARERDLIRDLADQADFLRPYEFLERALIRHGGRRRLLGRLGVEAEDAIDELLAQALAFERAATPSLAGFIDWIETGDIAVKREMEANLDAVRIMTVHGAKGLEAPIVILPDTVSDPLKRQQGPLLLKAEGGGNTPPMVLWAGRKQDDDGLTRNLREAHEDRLRNEWMRLLYVALTRAEDWLILCGAGDRKAADKQWYGLVERTMDQLPNAEIEGPEGLDRPIRRFELNPVPAGNVAEPETAKTAPEQVALPVWATPAPAEDRVKRRTPSGLADHVAAGGDGRGRDQALAHGNAVHRLLEVLPGHPAEARPSIARRLLDGEMPGFDHAPALAEAEAVLAAPFAPMVFGGDSLAEPGIALPDPHGGSDGVPAMIGRIDRLVIEPTEVLVIDFKTDAMTPAQAEDVPAAYLAQLAAYHRGVAALYPGREVRALLLYTRTSCLLDVTEAALATA